MASRAAPLPTPCEARAADPQRAAPGHQSDSALVCSSAPHPSDPQPPNLTTRRKKTDIPNLLSADILALRLQAVVADQMLWNRSAIDRLEPVMAHDAGSNLAMPRRR